jgi:hypothetical protein
LNSLRITSRCKRISILGITNSTISIFLYSYKWIFTVEMERVMGIEPTFEAWEAPVLPLNYTRKMVAARKFTTERGW